MGGAFEKVKMLDLTHVLAGPFCAYQFALLGADVVKIEPPHRPDCARGRGPDTARNAEGLGLNYQVQGGNKRALALDLRDDRGREIALRLARGADVFLENYTEGAMDRLGLGYDAVAAENRGIIYCSMTGFGSPGPRSAIGAYDNVIQAASGIIAQSGGHKPGLSFVDYATGYAAAFAIAAALHQRTRTGRGTRVDASMLEVALSLMAPEAAAEQYPVKAERRHEAGIVRYDTARGTLMPGAFTPAQYVTLGRCLAAEGIDVAELGECRDWPAVWERAEALTPRLAAIFATRTAEEWVSLLHRADLPAERVATLAEAVAHPQLEARGYFAASPGDPAATLPLAPYRLSEGSPALRTAPPRVGEHSEVILVELGLAPAEIETLRRDGVVA